MHKEMRMTLLMSAETTFANERDLTLALGPAQSRLTEIEKLHMVSSGINKLTVTFLGDNASTAITALLQGLPESSKSGSKKGPVVPRTPGQQDAYNKLRTHDLCFLPGPAGTGKTQMSVDRAVDLFLRNIVGRIVLTRPALEAGERLGFLPGDAKEKVDPYMQPLYDALSRHFSPEALKRHMDEKRIEIAPIAFMRGRTLQGAAIIIDEAQNLTTMQMKMALTRMGEGSWMAVAGDMDQIDLPSHIQSGLKDAIERLDGVENIAIARLTDADCVRSAMVRKILTAYATS